MKKIIFTLLVINSAISLHAQTPIYINDLIYGLDTINSRYDKLYYSEWYDECPRFNSDSAEFLSTIYSCGQGVSLRENYTPRGLKVNGIAALVKVCNYFDDSFWLDTTRLPEYVYAFQWTDSQTDSLILIDSARWDTVTPKVMRFPTISDSCNQRDTIRYPKYLYCYIYEAYFNKPITVDSTFFLGGTYNSNVREDGCHIYKPVTYFIIQPLRSNECPLKYYKNYYGKLGHYLIYRPFLNESKHGQFLPIVDYHNIHVISNDSTMGSVSGSTRIPEPWQDTIQAFPNPGFIFSHWNDGNTQNPRIVSPTSDTSFTAFFKMPEDLSVNLYSNNDEWGSVIGSGIYPEQQQITIQAIPNNGFIFNKWNDNDWHNPRTFTLTQDTSFTAEFEPDPVLINTAELLGIDIFPNPAHDKINILSDYTIEKVEIYSVNGKNLLSKNINSISATIDVSMLPNATYIVRIKTSNGIGFKKLVINP